jgi:1,4-alpha-glucan branching enzyme
LTCYFRLQTLSYYGWIDRSDERHSDAREYGGSHMGNLGGKWTDDWSYHQRPYSLDLYLPPLAVLVLKLDRAKTEEVVSQQ